MLNRAFDVVRILEEKEYIISPVLGSMDKNYVAGKINNLLGNEYAMYLKITKYNKDGSSPTIEINSQDTVNNPFPDNKNAVYGSKYYFVAYENEAKFYEVEYFIWQT